MGGRYLLEVADRLAAAGLVVVRYAGWESRARSSGGYTAPAPLGVSWHHTASRAAPETDAAFMCHTSENRPVANLLVARDGAVWVLAAGATNTAGKGGPCRLPDGVTVALDNANATTVGVEIANDGVGEPYPVAQVDAAFTASLVVCQVIARPPDAVFTHALGAGDGWTSRKIDPARTDAVAGSWRPRAVTSSGTWSLADLRAELVRRSSTSSGPPDNVEDDDVRVLVHHGPAGEWGDAWVVTSAGKYWLSTNEAIGQIARDVGYDPLPVDATWMRANGPVIGPNPVDGPGAPWGAYDDG